MARVTGLEPATSGVTGRHSNQLSYTRTFPCRDCTWPPGVERSFRGFTGECQARQSAICAEKRGGLVGVPPLAKVFARAHFFSCTKRGKSLDGAPRGRLAQLVERLVYTEDVGSSSLSSPTSLRPLGYGSAGPRFSSRLLQAQRAKAAAPQLHSNAGGLMQDVMQCVRATARRARDFPPGFRPKGRRLPRRSCTATQAGWFKCQSTQQMRTAACGRRIAWVGSVAATSPGDRFGQTGGPCPFAATDG